MKALILFLAIFSLIQLRIAGATTLNESVRIALKENKNLHAAVQDAESMKGKLLQAGKMPNPEFEAGIATGTAGHNRIDASFLQAFPLGGRLRKQREIARVDLASAQLEIADYQLVLAAEVKKRFLTALYKKNLISLHEKIRELKQSLLAHVKARIESGNATVFDLVNAEKDLFTTEATLVTLEGEAEAAALQLLPAMGSEADSIEIEGNFQMEIAKLETTQNLTLETVLTRRPDYKIAEINIDRLKEEKALARAESYGDLRAGLFVEQDRGGNSEDESLIGIKFSFTLPFWNRNEGSIQEKTALIAKGISLFTQRKLEIKADLKIAQNNRQRLRTLCKKYQTELAEKTETAHEFALKEYESGKSTLDRLIQATEALTLARAAHLECLNQYGDALAHLERVQGTFQGNKNFIR